MTATITNPARKLAGVTANVIANDFSATGHGRGIRSSAAGRKPQARRVRTTAGRLSVVACLDCGDDRLEVIARDDQFAGTLAQAKRHARQLARTLADRRSASVNVQVLDREDGDLLHDEHAVASLGPVAESIMPVTDDVRRVILAGFAAGLDERAIVRQIMGGAL